MLKNGDAKIISSSSATRFALVIHHGGFTNMGVSQIKDPPGHPLSLPLTVITIQSKFVGYDPH